MPFSYMATCLTKLLDFDPQVKSQIGKMIDCTDIHQDYNPQWSVLIIILISELEMLNFEDDSGMLIDIPHSILDKFFIVLLPTHTVAEMVYTIHVIGLVLIFSNGAIRINGRFYSIWIKRKLQCLTLSFFLYHHWRTNNSQLLL